MCYIDFEHGLFLKRQVGTNVMSDFRVYTLDKILKNDASRNISSLT